MMQSTQRTPRTASVSAANTPRTAGQSFRTPRYAQTPRAVTSASPRKKPMNLAQLTEEIKSASGLTRGRSPLHYAAERMDMDVVTAFVRGGHDVDGKDANGNTPLMYAAAQGRLEIVEYLIQMGARVITRNERGWTALHYAAMNGSAVCCAHLINQHSPVNAPSIDGLTPLHWAATHGHLDVVSVLLKNGAQIDQPCGDGRTALALAIHYNHDECAKFLISYGADWGVKDNSTNSPLSDILTSGKKELLDEVVSRAKSSKENASEVANYKVKDGIPALNYCVSLDNEPFVNLLIANNANPFETSPNGDSSLHVSVRLGNIAMAMNLSQKFPQLIEVKNSEGKVPFDIAQSMQKELDFEFLKVERVATPATKDAKKPAKKKK